MNRKNIKLDINMKNLMDYGFSTDFHLWTLA